MVLTDYASGDHISTHAEEGPGRLDQESRVQNSNLKDKILDQTAIR